MIIQAPTALLQCVCFKDFKEMSKAGVGLRHRKKPGAGQWVEECDVFVKVETDYADDQTLYGATVTLVTLILCGWLVWSDLVYYFNPSYR